MTAKRQVLNPKPNNGNNGQIGTIHHQQIVHSGPLPAPQILVAYDALLPGMADRLLVMVENESATRQERELMVVRANVATQAEQLRIAGDRTKRVFYSDTIGQTLGFFVSLTCVAAAVYLAMKGHEYVAVAIGSLPIAAVIKAFMIERKTAHPPKDHDQ